MVNFSSREMMLRYERTDTDTPIIGLLPHVFIKRFGHRDMIVSSFGLQAVPVFGFIVESDTRLTAFFSIFVVKQLICSGK